MVILIGFLTFIIIMVVERLTLMTCYLNINYTWKGNLNLKSY